ncbi:MAG TPA: hypothetical protein DF614_01025 [Methylococcaceae bacterium]|nr:hypothetical protein [Methylococcaceae bacterium]
MSTIKKKQMGRYLKLGTAATLSTFMLGYMPSALAGATFKIDDTKWVSVGAGLRTDFRAQEEAAPNGKTWNNDFNLSSVRLYVNGQIHKYLKVEFNTECQACGSGGEISVLDAIGKFEVTPMANLWVGRMLVPAERREMNGPYYSGIYNIFANGTPFEPSDNANTINSNGTSAGSRGRDDGATFWGAAFDGRFQYALGFFRGLRGGANSNDNILYAQRFAYNFWSVEKNPGYYTSGTYFGKGGDILTVAVSNQYQEGGAGTLTNYGNFRGTTADVLMEKVLGNGGVVTLNGEYKNYGVSGGTGNYDPANGGFALFEGNAYDVSGMYLFPQKIWIGQAQPFVRYVNAAQTHGVTRDVYEAGVNYVIDGHNAKVSLGWQYGDLLPNPTAAGNRLNAMTLGFQWQI